MWKTYQERTGREPDFKIRYRFIPYEEGGRVQAPYQGYRSDFHYDGEDVKTDGIYMIYPEFLNQDGSIMLEEETPVPESGEAYMWILSDEMKEYHRERVVPNRLVWLMEGSRKVAEATVIEQIGLGRL